MSQPAPKNPWIAFARRVAAPRLRLFCFPYAGGSAGVYRTWGERLPAEIELLPVELPGRASRFREPLLRSMPAVVAAVAAGIAPLFDRPFVFFGHSMGASIAFELARLLRDRGEPQPLHLFLSGRRAPQVPDDDEPMHALPDAEFMERLRKLNGTPEEALQHPELMQMMQPLLRADFEVIETYEPGALSPLTCPITVLGGIGDVDVSREALEGWREHTSGPFLVRMFPGDHFYLNHERGKLLEALARDLATVGA